MKHSRKNVFIKAFKLCSLPLKDLQNTSIVIFGLLFCHELCLEHSRKNVFIKGFKSCSLRLKEFQNTSILISCRIFCHELCMEHSRKNVFINGFKLSSYRFWPSKRPASSSVLFASVMNCAWNTLVEMSSLKDSTCAHRDCRTYKTPPSSSLALSSVMNCAWNTLVKISSLKDSSCAHCDCRTSETPKLRPADSKLSNDLTKLQVMLHFLDH